MIARRLFNENVIPACSSAAVLVVGNIVDAAVTGQCLGKEAVAAFGITNPILLGVIGLSGMLGVGTVIEIGQAVGKGEKSRVPPILATGLATGLALGTLLLFCLLVFPGQVAAAMGAGGTLAKQASDYLRGYSFGIPAFFVQCILGFIMPVDGDKKRVVAAMGASTAVNISLDLLNGFVLRWGLYGMALATSVSYWVELGVLALHFRRKNKLFRFSFAPFRFRALGPIVQGGVPYALQLLLRMLGVILINRIILSVSSVESVAVFSLLMSSANLILIDGTAVGATVLTVENCFVGEKDIRSVTELMKTALLHGVLVNLCLTALWLLAAPWILRLFTRDASVYEPAVHAFRLFATCPVIYAVNYAFRSHLQCIRRTGLSIAYAAFDVLIGPVAAAFLLSRFAGLNGIWLCYTVGEALALTGLFACSMMKNRAFSLRPADHLFLDPAWEREAKEEMSVSIPNGEGALRQAVEASAETIRFLIGRGADSRQANLLGLCAEEICSNIVRHGFKKPEHMLEMNVRKLPEGWTLSIRDNCAYFNVADYQLIQDRQKKKLGLSIVKGCSHDVKYMSALKINHVMVHVKPPDTQARPSMRIGKEENHEA